MEYKSLNLKNKFNLFNDKWSPKGIVNTGDLEPNNLIAKNDIWI